MSSSMNFEFDMITTRGGDSGKSSLFGGERRIKSDPVFTVLGNLDELTSGLGICRSAINISRASRSLGMDSRRKDSPGADSHGNDMAADIRSIQQELQNIAALIATPVSSLNTIKPLGKTDSEWESFLREKLNELERTESRYIAHITITDFIIPGDTEVSARFDLARTVCRRAERSLVSYIQMLPTEYYRRAQNYLNRLSDCLFVMARYFEQNFSADSSGAQG